MQTAKVEANMGAFKRALREEKICRPPGESRQSPRDAKQLFETALLEGLVDLPPGIRSRASTWLVPCASSLRFCARRP